MLILTSSLHPPASPAHRSFSLSFVTSSSRALAISSSSLKIGTIQPSTSSLSSRGNASQHDTFVDIGSSVVEGAGEDRAVVYGEGLGETTLTGMERRRGAE